VRHGACRGAHDELGGLDGAAARAPGDFTSFVVLGVALARSIADYLCLLAAVAAVTPTPNPTPDGVLFTTPEILPEGDPRTST